MSKIENDKYYTPISLANHCWEKVDEIIGLDNISHIIEPSCGNGSFYHYHKRYPDLGVDIKPEIECLDKEEPVKLVSKFNIITTDYLTYEIDYQSGRLIIGNPPYGRCLNLAQKFYKKSIKIADYIAFILPISQLNNSSSMYEFDLVYSEDLGVCSYSDRKLHCCFNIYRRPLNKNLNTKPVRSLEAITIYRQDIKDYENKPYDIRMCYWGDGCAGKILSSDEHYSAEYKIKINNPELKDEIISLLQTFNWSDYLNCIAMRKIYQYHIIDILKKNIKDIS